MEMKSPQTVFKDGLDKAYSGVKANMGTMTDHAIYKQGVTEDGTPMIKRSVKKFLHQKKKDVKEAEGHSKYYPGGKTPGLTSDVLNTILTNIGKKGMDDKGEVPKNEFKKTKKKETNEQDEVTEKWSEKYKKSIDCSNPKGFSQRAHCDGRKKEEPKENLAKKQFSQDLMTDKDYLDFKKRAKYKNRGGDDTFGTPNVSVNDPYIQKTKFSRPGKEETKEATGSGSSGSYVGPVFGGDNKFWERSRSENPKLKESDVDKVEAKEATTTGSSGGYESPSMWAKSTKKKDWGPSRKTQIPGGGFVKIKKKCTKFPYCNQGDISNVKISKNESVKEAIKNVARKTGVSENVIKTILEYEYEKIGKRNK